MMDKARCYVNLRESEEKAKEYQHLTVSKYNLPNRSEAWYTHSFWTFYVSTISQIAF